MPQFALFLEGPPQNDWIACQPSPTQVIPGIGWNPISRWTTEILLKVYHYIEKHRHQDGPSACEVMIDLYPQAHRQHAELRMWEILTERLVTGEISDGD